MADIQYEMKIISMSAYPEYNGKPDCVFNIVWAMEGTDGVYSARHVSSTNVLHFDSSPYTEYDLIRQPLACEWILQAVGDDYLQDVRGYVAKQIADQIKPSTELKPLPWDI